MQVTILVRTDMYSFSKATRVTLCERTMPLPEIRKFWVGDES